MNFKQYEYVITLSEERSFSKAAARLFISQPSLSQYINRIEGELGAVLFDRGCVPLNLTYEGSMYVETAKQIIGAYRQLLNTLDESKKLERGWLNIGATPSKANHLMPLILPAFAKKYPHIDLSVTEMSSSGIEEMLEKGLIDLGILNLPQTSPGIICEPLYNERILLAVPRNQFGVSGFVSYDDIKKLRECKFILLRPGQRLRQIANDIFAKAGVKPKILLETGNIETSAKLAKAGLGCAFVPEMFAAGKDAESRALFLPVAGESEDALTWTVGAAFPKERYVTKAARAFLEVTNETVKERGAGNI